MPHMHLVIARFDPILVKAVMPEVAPMVIGGVVLAAVDTACLRLWGEWGEQQRRSPCNKRREYDGALSGGGLHKRGSKFGERGMPIPGGPTSSNVGTGRHQD